MKKIKLSRGIQLFPTLLTTGGMFFAFFSIVRSINGDHRIAAWAIFIACFFDMMDGRVARMTRTQSDFGKEYDSLVDLASFGLAPSILVYTWSLSRFQTFGWIFSFLFFACAALRLARFNVQTATVEKRTFQGLPSPPAACLVASLVLFYQHLYGMDPIRSLLALILVPVLALLMVSRFSYQSFKEFDVGRRNTFYVLLAAAALIGIVAINPDVVLFVAFLIYALSGPVAHFVVFDKKRPLKMRTRSRRLTVVNSKPVSLEDRASR